MSVRDWAPPGWPRPMARTSCRASVGRVHEIPMPRNLGAVGTASATYTDTYDNNLDGVFETSFVTPGSTSAATDRYPDPDHHQPYIDEWTVGYRRQLPGGVALDAGFSHRSYKDLPALVETNGIYEGSVFRGTRTRTSTTSSPSPTTGGTAWSTRAST